jgi:hypothetical protein
VTTGRIEVIGGRSVHLGGRKVPRVRHTIWLDHPKYGLNLGVLAKLTSVPFIDYGTNPACAAVLRDILGNDAQGDCTEADQYHRQAMRQAAAGGAVYHPTLSQVLATYSRDSGYIIGQPATDVGCDENTVLSNAQFYGISCGPAATDVNKIQAYALVGTSNTALTEFCLSEFVGGSFCTGLPDYCVSPMPSGPGWLWQIQGGSFQADPRNGHCMSIGGYDRANKIIKGQSWGMPFEMSYDFFIAGSDASNNGSFMISLDQDMINAMTGKAPDLLDWQAVLTDYSKLPSGVMTPPGP